MKNKKRTGILSLLLIFTTITACSTPANTTPQKGPSLTGNGLCANPYYPVREGATWSYQSTGGLSKKFDFSDTITSVHENGFTLTSQIADLTRTQEWSCNEEGLSALQLGGPAANILSSQDIDLDLNYNNVEGVTYPAKIEEGMQWQQTIDFNGDMVFGGQNATSEGNAQTSFLAIGRQNVTVPAGTFDAIVVEANTTINISMKIQDITLPVLFSSSSTYWLVEGIGWVKIISDGNFANKEFTETIELESYNIQ